MEYTKGHGEDCVCIRCLTTENLLYILEDHFIQQTPEIQTKITRNVNRLMEELRQRKNPN